MKSVAFASAKGGVGKTNLSVGTAIALAHMDAKVLLVDGDLGLANIDILLNLKPTVTLKHVVCDAVDLGSAITEGPGGVSVLCGGSGIKELAEIEPEMISEIVNNIESLSKDFDYIVYDTGSGIRDNTMAFLQSVDRVAIVCTPDPTSIMDAYATAKILFEKKPEADVALLVNMADEEKSGQIVFARFRSIIGQFLNKEVTLAGIVCYDSSVKQATRARTSVLLSHPKCKASKAIAELADRITEPTIDTESNDSLGLLQRVRSVFGFLSKSKPEADKSEPLKRAA